VVALVVVVLVVVVLVVVMVAVGVVMVQMQKVLVMWCGRCQRKILVKLSIRQNLPRT
jgi:hypothetical protein